MSTIVTKDQDISSIENGEFIFCKELSKGFIKRDISELSSVQFEAVANEIEALSLEVLNTLGLDSVQFGDKFDDARGEIKIGQQRNSEIKTRLDKLPFGIPKMNVINLISTEKSKSRYFKADTTSVKRGTCVTINGTESTEGFEVKVYTPNGSVVGETIVLEDGTYSTTICNLMVGRFQLTIVITGPDGEREELFTTVEVYDDNLKDTFNSDNPSMTSDPVTGEAEPNEEITLFDSNGNIVGMGKADSEGKYSIVPVGLSSSSSSVSIVKGDFHGGNNVSANSTSANISPVVSTFNPSNISLSPSVISKSETKTDILEIEEEKPFIAGDGVPCNQVVILLPNGTEVGRGIVNKDGKYKVMLHDISNDYQGDINITFRDIGVECLGENFQSVVELESPLVKETLDTGIPQSDLVNGFKLEINYTVGDDVSGLQGLIGYHNADHGVVAQGDSTDNRLRISFPGQTAVDDGEKDFGHFLISGETHNMVMIYDGVSSYTLIIDDESFTNNNATFESYSGNLILGSSLSDDRYFLGTINSFKLSIKV